MNLPSRDTKGGGHVPTWPDYLQTHRPRFLAEMQEFLRIPSVSAQPQHAADVDRAAAWLFQRLKSAGLEGVRVMPTGGPPVVYGEWLNAPGKPTVLIYGHYDVQPAEPVGQWTHPPFDPIVRGDRLYARGASDDKGNLLIPILAIEAVLRTAGRLPVNVRLICEGEEEVGSPHLPAFLEPHRELLACDFVLSADGGQHGENQPSLTIGCRGLCALQVDVRGPSVALHSGTFGGAVQNPIHALVRMLDSLRAADGRILVPGFYADVLSLADAEREAIRAIPWEDELFRLQAGVPALHGEPGYTALERTWVRPTLEVNGIWGGFTGDGSQTIIPAEAHAKLTCRLVPDQEPDRVAALVEAHLRAQAPPGVTVSVHQHAGSARPYRMAAGHPANMAAHAVLAEVYGREPLYVHMGATIPACELFQRTLGVETVLFAFGLDDENIHAPDEFLRLTNWDRGQFAYGRLLERLGRA